MGGKNMLYAETDRKPLFLFKSGSNLNKTLAHLIG